MPNYSQPNLESPTMLNTPVPMPSPQERASIEATRTNIAGARQQQAFNAENQQATRDQQAAAKELQLENAKIKGLAPQYMKADGSFDNEGYFTAVSVINPEKALKMRDTWQVIEDKKSAAEKVSLESQGLKQKIAVQKLESNYAGLSYLDNLLAKAEEFYKAGDNTNGDAYYKQALSDSPKIVTVDEKGVERQGVPLPSEYTPSVRPKLNTLMTGQKSMIDQLSSGLSGQKTTVDMRASEQINTFLAANDEYNKILNDVKNKKATQNDLVVAQGKLSAELSKLAAYPSAINSLAATNPYVRDAKIAFEADLESAKKWAGVAPGAAGKKAEEEAKTDVERNKKIVEDFGKYKKAQSQRQETIDLITELESKISALPTGININKALQNVPGTEAQTLKSKLSQLISKLQLAGRGQLKGQGAITDIEQAMLSNSQTTLTNLDQGQGALLAEFKKLKKSLMKADETDLQEYNALFKDAKTKDETMKLKPLGSNSGSIDKPSTGNKKLDSELDALGL